MKLCNLRAQSKIVMTMTHLALLIFYHIFEIQSLNIIIMSSVFFKNIRNEIIINLEKAQSEILIAVAWFTDKRIIQTLQKLRENNIDIKIVAYDHHINDVEIFRELHNSGAHIYFSKKMMHNKFCIIDQNTIINGSYNWTTGASRNNENIMVTNGNSNLVAEFRNEFNRLIEISFPVAKKLKTREEKFQNYLEKQSQPEKFPCFLKVKTDRSGILRRYPMEYDGFIYYFFLSEENFKQFYKNKFDNNNFDKTPAYLSIHGGRDAGNFIYFVSDKITLKQYIFEDQQDKYFVYRLSIDGKQLSEKIQICHSEYEDEKDIFIALNKKSLYLPDLRERKFECDFLTILDNFVIVFRKDLYNTNLWKNYFHNYGKKGYLSGLFDLEGNRILETVYNDIEFNKNGILTFVAFPYMDRSSLERYKPEKFKFCPSLCMDFNPKSKILRVRYKNSDFYYLEEYLRLKKD